MGNPILQILNAGHGETPECPDAAFKKGDVVRLRRRKHLAHLPKRGAVAAVVPPGFPPEYALADAAGRPRPLLITRPSRAIKYIVGFDNDPVPHLLIERDLLQTDEEPVTVGWSK